MADEKETAEHVMLVDLARNDLGRVAKAGTVEVKPYRTIERYSHVMHTVSGVEGQIAEDVDAFDLFAATFPAGTVVGAPKVKAMQIIDDSGAVAAWDLRRDRRVLRTRRRHGPSHRHPYPRLRGGTLQLPSGCRHRR